MGTMKKLKIVLSPQALNDIKEANAWYNQQQKGLGKRLKVDVRKVIASISLNPYSASVKYDNIRTAACKTSPYSVHYEIDEKNGLVRIISIFHFSRKRP